MLPMRVAGKFIHGDRRKITVEKTSSFHSCHYINIIQYGEKARISDFSIYLRIYYVKDESFVFTSIALQIGKNGYDYFRSQLRKLSYQAASTLQKEKLLGERKCCRNFPEHCRDVIGDLPHSAALPEKNARTCDGAVYGSLNQNTSIT